MAKRLNQHDFELRIMKSLGKQYQVLGKYINTSTKIKMLHNLCGKEFVSRPKDMIKTTKPTGCPHCYGTPKKTMEILSCEIDNIHGHGRYSVLNESYTGNKMDIDVLCNDCNAIFTTKPYRITSNVNGCPHCAGLYKLSIDDMQHSIDKIKGINFLKIISGDSRNLTVRINNCGHIYDGVTFSNLKVLKQCKICNNRRPYTPETIREKFENIDSEYVVISNNKYINSKHVLLHTECGEKFNCYYYNFADRNQRCPKCTNYSMSIPEKRIYEFLSTNKVSFEYSTYFDWLYRLKPLEVDFLIDDSYCIEYDGEFHFKKMYRSQDIDIGRTNDITKDALLHKHGYKLIRIPYKYKRHINRIMSKILYSDNADLIKSYPLLYVSDPEHNFYHNTDSYYNLS